MIIEGNLYYIHRSWIKYSLNIGHKPMGSIPCQILHLTPAFPRFPVSTFQNPFPVRWFVIIVDNFIPFQLDFHLNFLII